MRQFVNESRKTTYLSTVSGVSVIKFLLFDQVCGALTNLFVELNVNMCFTGNSDCVLEKQDNVN